MKLLKFLLGIVAIAIIPLCTVAIADNCFESVVDIDGKVLYIDPFDKYRIFEDKKFLQSMYGDKIKCTGEKKVYSRDEYLNEIYKNLNKQEQKQKNNSQSGGGLLELIMLILWCVAMRKIFVKAGKPGYCSLIPIYNFYEMSDIAGLSGLFKKAVRCLILGFLMIFISLHLMPIALFPQIGAILVIIFQIYIWIVDYYLARNFGWSTTASILYVIFNPIAVLILAFGNDKYYLTKQNEKKEGIMHKKNQFEENLNLEFGESKDSTTDGIDDLDINTYPENDPQPEEDPIKYIDPNQFT